MVDLVLPLIHAVALEDILDTTVVPLLAVLLANMEEYAQHQTLAIVLELDILEALVKMWIVLQQHVSMEFVHLMKIKQHSVLVLMDTMELTVLNFFALMNA